MKKKPNFLRRAWYKYSKLGKRRKKKQKWRRPNGRDNKMREKKKGYASVVSVGYKNSKKQNSLIDNKKTIIIKNLEELKKTKNKTIIIGKIGKKKKIEIAKFAKEHNKKIHNLNILKFLEKNEPKK
jgi:large subunit ribosomal protein L32e